MHSQHPPSPELVGGRETPPTPGLGAGMGQGVPAEEHETGLIFKGFSSLIFCGSASVLGVDFLLATEIRKSVLSGDFHCQIYVSFDLLLSVVQDVQGAPEQPFRTIRETAAVIARELNFSLDL